MILDDLIKIIQDRKQKLPKNSYITSLFTKGQDGIIQKVGEEATEVVIAAKNNNKVEIINELADLWFHTLVLMVSFNIEPQEIYQELNKRRYDK